MSVCRYIDYYLNDDACVYVCACVFGK